MMKIGFKLPNCAGVLCEPEWATPATLVDLTHLAQSLGYDSLWLHDHLLPPDEVQLACPDFHEPLMTIAHLASLVPAIQFGVATIVLPLRDPLLLARQASTLHAFLPGRLILGVGIGRYESEFLASGSSLFRRRGKVTNEYLELLRALWQPGVTHFEGEFRSVKGARFYPKPNGQNGVPIWVGGNAPAAVRRAAWLGDGYVPAAKLAEEIRADRQMLHEEMAKAGRDPAGFPVGLSLTVELMRPSDSQVEDLEERGMHGHARDRIVRGHPEQVAARLNEFGEVGVNHLLLSFRANDLSELKERMAWFVEDVRPLLHVTA
jgi:probable F420-dependent oxidoreductase